MKKISVLPVLMVLGGCSFVPDYVRPDIKFGNSWGAQALPQNLRADEAGITRDWWTKLGSNELNRLVEQSLKNNNNLTAAAERIAQARGSLTVAGASLLPSVSAGLSSDYTRADLSEQGSERRAARAAATYEIDLFGANRSGRVSEKEKLAAAGFDRDALALTTASDVAQTYINTVSVRERIALAQESLEAAKRTLALLELRLNVGASGLLEVTQQRTAVAQAEANVASLRELEATYRNALAILVGTAPQDFMVSATSLAGMVLPEVPVSAPATLLERRPDLKVAEANLKAANGNIGAARAAFFPTLSLSAGLTQAIDPAGTALALGADVLAPIFNGGANAGALKAANARQREVAANYRQAVLTAFGEVGNALAALESAQARAASQGVAAENAATALRLARLRLDAGTVDLPTLLGTQTSELNAKDAAVQARAAALAGSVQVVRVMGGGAGTVEVFRF